MLTTRKITKTARRRKTGRHVVSPAQLSIPFLAVGPDIRPSSVSSSSPSPLSYTSSSLAGFLETLDGVYSEADLRLVREVLFRLAEFESKPELLSAINHLRAREVVGGVSMVVNSDSASFVDIHNNDCCDVRGSLTGTFPAVSTPICTK